MHRKEKEIYGKEHKKIPHLASEAAERKFWEKHDSTSYVDWTQAQRVRFPELNRSTAARLTNYLQRQQLKKLTEMSKEAGLYDWK